MSLLITKLRLQNVRIHKKFYQKNLISVRAKNKSPRIRYSHSDRIEPIIYLLDVEKLTLLITKKCAYDITMI